MPGSTDPQNKPNKLVRLHGRRNLDLFLILIPSINLSYPLLLPPDSYHKYPQSGLQEPFMLLPKSLNTSTLALRGRFRVSLGELVAQRKYVLTFCRRSYGSLLVTPVVCLTVIGICSHFSTHICCKVYSAVFTDCPKGQTIDAEDCGSYSFAILLASLRPNKEIQCSAGKLEMFRSVDPSMRSFTGIENRDYRWEETSMLPVKARGIA